MTRLVLLLALIGCAKKEQSSDQVSAQGGGGAAATNSPLPEFKLKPVEDGEAASIAELEERTASQVSKWLQAEPTRDGWIVSYEMPRLENVQDEKTLKVELKQTGVDFGVYVRRKIDGKPYKCVTTHIEKREDIARVVAACKTAKP